MLIEQQSDNSFFSLTKVINSLNSLFFKKTPEQIAVEALREKVQGHIDRGNIEYVFAASDNGYVFTQKQAQQLSNIFINFLDKNELHHACNMVRVGYQLNGDDIVELLFNREFIKNNLQDIYTYYNGNIRSYTYEKIEKGNFYNSNPDILSKAFIEYQQDSTNSNMLFRIWIDRMQEMGNYSERKKEYLSGNDESLFGTNKSYIGYTSMFSYFALNHKTALANSETYHEAIHALKNIEDDSKILRHSYSQYAHHNDSQCRYLIQHLEEDLNHKIGVFFKSELQQLISDTRNVKMTQLVGENLNKKVKEQHYNVNHLPSEALKHLKEIEECYTNLQAHTSKMNQEQQFEMKNLVEKRLPEILQKYFNIDEEYRNTLKTVKGETPQDLLLYSLNVINENIHSLEILINEQHMQELQVSKKYLSGMRRI